MSSLEREQNLLTSSRELKFGRLSPHAFHLDKKVEVFAAEASPDHRKSTCLESALGVLCISCTMMFSKLFEPKAALHAGLLAFCVLGRMS